MSVAIFIITLVVALALAALFAWRSAGYSGVQSVLLKTAASIGFVLLGFAAFSGADGDIQVIVLGGLVMGLIGDIYLGMNHLYAKHAELYTYAGIIAFILGHIFYLAFMLAQYDFTVIGLIVGLVLGLGVGAFIYISQNLFDMNYGRFRIICSAYAALLVFITVYAVSVMIAAFTLAKFLFFLGILSFLFSDLVLSQIYFGKDKNTPLMSMINHASYYVGQILIAASIFFIR